MKDLYSNIKVSRAVSPVSVSDNTPLVSQVIDTQGYNSLVYAILLGAIADADATFGVLVEHGDESNLSDAAPVPDEELNGTESGAAFQFDSDNQTRKIGYVGGKRYTRITVTPSANASAALIGVLAIQGKPNLAPTV